MQTPLHTELVGILVGQILSNSQPIVIRLYIRPNGVGHTRTSEYPEVCSPLAAIEEIVDSFGTVVRSVWRNNFDPPWYYVQLYPGAQPSQFLLWSMPWTATRAYMRIPMRK